MLGFGDYFLLLIIYMLVNDREGFHILNSQAHEVATLYCSCREWQEGKNGKERKEDDEG